MKIKLLGMCSSPRETSNSKILLEESLKTLSSELNGNLTYEIINLREFHIRPCMACRVCGKDKFGTYLTCVQHDDDNVADLQGRMLAADGLIVSTPVYFGLPSDLFFTFINRTRILRHQDFSLANKPVAIMAVAGRRSGGGETTITSAWNPFLRHGCLPVGNGGGTSQYGAIGWANKSGNIRLDTWGMQQGLDLVRRVYSLAKILKSGIEAEGYAFPMVFSDIDGKPDFDL